MSLASRGSVLGRAVLDLGFFLCPWPPALCPRLHLCLLSCRYQIILITVSEVESRTQGSRPRPRTQKKSEAKAKYSLSEDRHSRGQGQECSRPRPRTKDTAAIVLKKKSLQKSFSGNLQFIGVARIFDWQRGPNHKSHAMTSSKIFKRETFCGTKI